ncbi:hypothetical protein [Alienimonas chondri]|uniref:Uncharacterized protein n=1 Tax=Alienimonas chondri TaxID=2681879 RepID=A0ABX1VHI4_9PLAN|nr:hypothetical protein [Alienimonas chondri]NNJ27550.1 hypothetical protein [Alienimonas chondri]
MSAGAVLAPGGKAGRSVDINKERLPRPKPWHERVGPQPWFDGIRPKLLAAMRRSDVHNVDHLGRTPAGEEDATVLFHPWTPSARFRGVFDRVVAPTLQLRNGERCRADTATALLALYRAAKRVMVVSDSRGHAGGRADSRNAAWDRLCDAGWAMKRTGSESASRVTRYGLTAPGRSVLRDALDPSAATLEPERHELPKRLSRRQRSRGDGSTAPAPNPRAPVVWRDAKQRDADGRKITGKMLTLPNPLPAQIQLAWDQNKRLNAGAWEHEWAVRIFPQAYKTEYKNATPAERAPLRALMRAIAPTLEPVRLTTEIEVSAIYNVDFEHGGRNYATDAFGYTHLHGLDRRTMTCDGELLCELDYGGFHPRMLNHIEGIDPAPGADIYKADEVLPEAVLDAGGGTVAKWQRDAVKVATNIIINAETLRSAIGAINRDEDIGRHELFKPWMDRKNIDAEKLIARIKREHKPIKRHFHSGVGLRLQCEDGKLMRSILCAMFDAGKPALGLHDAILCRESDQAFARDLMTDFYVERYGFRPVISAK